MSDDLSRAMRATAEDLTPNIGKLTAGGVERGVRKRRVRRLAQITGAAASVTAVFGVVAAVGTGGSGSSGTPASAAAGAAAAAPSTTGAPTTAAKAPAVPAATSAAQPSQSADAPKPPTPAHSFTPPHAPSAPPVSGEDMVKWFKQELTAANVSFSSESVLNKAGTETAGGPYAVLTVHYAAGAGSVSVNVSTTSWGDVTYGSSLPPTTTISTLPDGSHLVVYNGLQWPAGNGDPTAKRLDATWYRNDGTSVNVEAINEVQEKGATTASAVPLTPEQASKIATSPIWNTAAAAKAYQWTLDYQQAMKDKGKSVGGDAAKPTNH